MSQPIPVQETDTKLAEKQVNTQTQTAESKPLEETQEQINWKKFRETREKERKEKEAADKRAAEK